MTDRKMKRTNGSGRPEVNKERRILMGQIIRKYRKEAGLDQAVLAQKLGLTQTAIGNWEQGITRPDIDTLPGLCDILHIPITELLGFPTEAALTTEDRNILNLYHQLDKYNQGTIVQLMDRLAFQQGNREKEKLRSIYTGLHLYEEAAAAGVGTPMADYAQSKTVYAPKAKIPGGADTVIHVNGTSMEPTFPNGSYVYVSTGSEISYGQIGIFIVNGESFIKEYQPEGLVSHNKHFKTISTAGDTDVRCFGRVTGLVGNGDIASGSLLEKIDAAFHEEEQ